MAETKIQKDIRGMPLTEPGQYRVQPPGGELLLCEEKV
jgi:hypothetical protein